MYLQQWEYNLHYVSTPQGKPDSHATHSPLSTTKRLSVSLQLEKR